MHVCLYWNEKAWITIFETIIEDLPGECWELIALITLNLHFPVSDKHLFVSHKTHFSVFTDDGLLREATERWQQTQAATICILHVPCFLPRKEQVELWRHTKCTQRTNQSRSVFDFREQVLWQFVQICNLGQIAHPYTKR